MSIPPHLRERFARLLRRTQSVYGLVSRSPAILHVQIYRDTLSELLDSFAMIFQAMRGRPLAMLCSHGALDEWLLEGSLQLTARCAQAFPDVRFYHLCNQAESVATWLDQGLQAIHCNHNAFVDERIYLPLEGVTKNYRAVYDARLVPCKRHALAAQVEQLALIYYVVPLVDDLEYAEKIRHDFGHAHFFNHRGGAYHRLGPQAINKGLNCCRIGLCLSEAEGAMYASVQYLLSGLGVVSTPSQGGRDDFLDRENSLVAEPTPEAVSQAVSDLLARQLDPWEVHRATRRRMEQHRKRFFELVQSIFKSQGEQRRFEEEWLRLFFNRFLGNQSHQQTLRWLSGAEGQP